MAVERSSVTTSGAVTDVAVRALASGGAGVGELEDGRVVFVPRTAPGDRAKVRITKAKKRWALAELEELLEASPSRVEPECPHFTECGGCQLQHVPYPEQLLWKGRFIEDALRRIGHVEAQSVSVHPAPQETRYRSRVTFTLRRLRGGRTVAGFHALNRPAHVLDIGGECLLPTAPLAEVWSALRAGWGDGARYLPAAARLRLTLREAADGVELTVGGGDEGWNPSRLVDAVPGLSAVWHTPKHAETRLVAGLTSDGGGGAFEQVNRAAAAALRARVVEAVGHPSEEGGRVVDAYCGVGEYGRALAELGWDVEGVEVDPGAVEAANSGAPERFRAVRRPVEDNTEGDWAADVVVLNPPREGVAPSALSELALAAPSRIVYVSCDPATLARDVAALSERYDVTEISAFDLFPQTAHVEAVLILRHRGETA